MYAQKCLLFNIKGILYTGIEHQQTTKWRMVFLFNNVMVWFESIAFTISTGIFCNSQAITVTAGSNIEKLISRGWSKCPWEMVKTRPLA